MHLCVFTCPHLFLSLDTGSSYSSQAAPPPRGFPNILSASKCLSHVDHTHFLFPFKIFKNYILIYTLYRFNYMSHSSHQEVRGQHVGISFSPTIWVHRTEPRSSGLATGVFLMAHLTGHTSFSYKGRRYWVLGKPVRFSPIPAFCGLRDGIWGLALYLSTPTCGGIIVYGLKMHCWDWCNKKLNSQ